MSRIILLACTLLIFSILGGMVLSAPSLEMIAVNNVTKECVLFFAGDECVRNELPLDWQDAKADLMSRCPEGFLNVSINLTSISQKNQFCCTIEHSGYLGACDDVVVNFQESKCAFVLDINNCKSLPLGWERAKETAQYGRACPSKEYQWLGKILDCEKRDTENISRYQEQDKGLREKNNRTGLFIAIGIALILIIFFYIIYHISAKKES